MKVDSTKHAIESLGLDKEKRAALWDVLGQTIESYITTVEDCPVSPALDVESIRRFARSFGFEERLEPVELLHRVAVQLKQFQVHTPHPCYFGLFNPAPSAMSIAADALVAALNPQLAAWSHSPLAVEIEQHLVRTISAKFGFDKQVDGTFTTAGAEANQTALLAALQHRWPEVAIHGLRALKEEPVFYVSREGHHSFLKAARVSGLGTNSLREVQVKDDLTLDVNALNEAIRHDRAHGKSPFLLVATAGTTASGAIDPLPVMAEMARAERLWFHVDAAWGGAAALSPKLAPVLSGIEHADSITFDAHKMLSVSMGAGMFLTSHSDILERTFRIQTAYMPKEGRGLATVDPFTHSIQWSRRFIGLKLFLTLAVSGWEGYAETIDHQCAMADFLRKRLTEEKWRIVNRTALPLVCFTDEQAALPGGECQKIADAVVASGKAWISTVELGEKKQPALRACITNYKTQPEHIETLITILNEVRQSLE